MAVQDPNQCFICDKPVVADTAPIFYYPINGVSTKMHMTCADLVIESLLEAEPLTTKEQVMEVVKAKVDDLSTGA